MRTDIEGKHNQYRNRLCGKDAHFPCFRHPSQTKSIPPYLLEVSTLAERLIECRRLSKRYRDRTWFRRERTLGVTAMTIHPSTLGRE